MNNAKIRQALETHGKALAPAFPTAYENVNFSPPSDGAPFQAFYLLFAEPDDAGDKDSDFIQRGLFTIGLFYPTNQGPALAQSKAEDFRIHFKRGTSLPIGDNSVIIDRTPEISGGAIEDNRFVIRVRIRFYAQLPRL